ncbi:MAG: DNA-processing protein DprA [Thermoleophilaceae bacterium]
MTPACDECLRRGHLVGLLAPRVGALLGDRSRPPAGLLALADEDLVTAVCGAGARGDEARLFLASFDPGRARSALVAEGVEAACPHGEDYPQALLDLDDPPAALFVVGGLDRLRMLAGNRAVTVVGARKASAYGLEMGRGLGRGLAAAGLTVVSGLALGIDAAAHRGACAAPRGGAVAVIARGPERCYPTRNRELYRQVLERGCVVSELPPGTPVFRWAFPARNRIMAALAELTIVVEAADPSGSLITADFAGQLHRRVAAVPGRATTRVAAGSNGLLRDGADLVLDARGVLDILFGVGGGPEPAAAKPVALEDPALRRVLEAVERADAPPELSALTGLSASDVRAALGRLELLGLIVRAGAGRYTRAVV